MLGNYVCETVLSDADIHAADNGDSALVPWRTDAHGRRWFKRLPTIYGTPKEVESIGADGDIEGDELETGNDDE